MQTLYVLVVLSFSFLQPYPSDVIIMKSTKVPYPFLDKQSCDDEINELHRLSPNEDFDAICRPVTRKIP